MLKKLLCFSFVTLIFICNCFASEEYIYTSGELLNTDEEEREELIEKETENKNDSKKVINEKYRDISKTFKGIV